MPNKEISVKTMPKSNGNDAIRTQAKNDVIAIDVKKGTNSKKLEKHKNKEIIKAIYNPNAVNMTENGLNTNTNDGHDDDAEVHAISEELLRRLQCNGTSISVRKSDDTLQQISPKQGDNELNSSDKSKSQQKSKKLNNNNNNNNSSKAHNKNCQNQHKLANTVNSSSKNVEINSEYVQCNGTHLMPTEQSTESGNAMTTNNRLPSPGTSKSFESQVLQFMAATTSKEIVQNTPSCSNHSNQPSTSVLIPNQCTSSLPTSALSVKSIKTPTVEITFKEYENELQMPDIMRVIQRELSEPYSIYTYRYFIHNWPKLCFLAMDGDNCIGAIVCKLDVHRQMTKRGYIAMLAVDAAYRKLKVGTTLVQKAIEAMLEHNADEVVLETEITNIPALRLYENLGFVRDKRLFDYYLNGVDALRLKLWFK